MFGLCWRFSVLTFLAFGITASQASAQAYCKLRDPVSQIKTLYPDSRDYRSIVRTVNAGARNAVGNALPFDLHFNELGRHTLYVAQEGKRPVGLIHARSEEGPWGLVEIVWALNFDMTVKNFFFQRCRSPFRAEVEGEKFKELLLGKSLDEIGELLAEDGKTLNVTNNVLSTDAMELGLAVVRSAMKTIVVTDHVWESDIRTLMAFSNVTEWFDGADFVETIEDVYSPSVLAALEKRGLADTDLGIDRESVTVLLAYDKDKSLLGLRVSTEWRYGENPVSIWWTLTPEPMIMDVSAVTGWPEKAMDDAFKLVVGLNIAGKSADCSSFAGLMACEVLVVAQAQLE